MNYLCRERNVLMQIESLIQKASTGDANAQNKLGDAYHYGVCGEDGEELILKKDGKQAVEWYRKAAEQGHTQAQANLAWMYQYGEGVRKNQKQAFVWYRKAAEHGCASAQASLAGLYRDGEGVAQDEGQAIFWFRKAAELGGKEYQRRLAEVLMDEEPQEAAQWYQLAAEAGDAEAQFELAELYEQGNSVPKDDEEAFRWYSEAERQDYSHFPNNARYEVGRCYATGRGVEKNSDEALKRLLPIADPRVTEDSWQMSRAQIWVVTVFADPEHTKHDLVEAYAWVNLAAAYAPTGEEFYGIMSRESATKFRDRLGARLSKEQLKQAQLRSKELFVSRQEIDKRLGRP